MLVEAGGEKRENWTAGTERWTAGPLDRAQLQTRRRTVAMPMLPIIDLLILLGWTTLGVGGLLKLTGLAMNSYPSILGLSSIDFLLIGVVFMLMALTLAARIWVRANEPALQRADTAKRAAETLDLYAAAHAPARSSEVDRPDLAPAPVYEQRARLVE
jgi:hypothetical protein